MPHKGENVVLHDGDAKYGDVVAFLNRVENPKRAQMNQRSPISPQEAAALQRRFRDVPDDYIAYLCEVGFGSFRECGFMVYNCLGTPDAILGKGVLDWLSPGIQVLCFGDNFSGDLSGFLPEKEWAVVELWHDAGRIHEVGKSFGDYIRDIMGMGREEL